MPSRRLSLALVCVAGAAVYLPTAQSRFVQDDRAIIAANPRAHSVSQALRAFDEPYWPTPSGGEYYRPLTILSYAVDWTLSGGRAGWLHLMNALWHGLVSVLVVLVLERWLSPAAAAKPWRASSAGPKCSQQPACSARCCVPDAAGGPPPSRVRRPRC